MSPLRLLRSHLKWEEARRGGENVRTVTAEKEAWPDPRHQYQADTKIHKNLRITQVAT